jgi:cell division transport system permease protein
MEERNVKGKIRGAYFTSLVSIFLVLLLIGMIGLLLLNSREVSNYVKENLCFSLSIKPHVKLPDVQSYKKKLDTYYFIRATEIITSDQAADEIKADLGEDFIEVLGYNPLPTTINVFLRPEYASSDSLAKVKQILFADTDYVDDISGQENLVTLIDRNIRKISLILFVFSAILIFISFALLNNTIRLMIFSKRALIKTMQLVGAKNSFIRRPLLLSGIGQGLFGALLAALAIIALKYLLDMQIGNIYKISFFLLGQLCSIILILGILFSLICTYFSVNKYLKASTERLFY